MIQQYPWRMVHPFHKRPVVPVDLDSIRVYDKIYKTKTSRSIPMCQKPLNNSVQKPIQQETPQKVMILEIAHYIGDYIKLNEFNGQIEGK